MLALRNKSVAARPAPNVEKVNRWLQTLNAKANTIDSRFYTSQLSSLFNFYAKPSQQTLQVPSSSL